MKLRIYSYNAKTLLYESVDIEELISIQILRNNEIELYTDEPNPIIASWENQTPPKSKFSGLAITPYSNTTLSSVAYFNTTNNIDLYEIYTPDYSSASTIKVITYINTAEHHRINKTSYLEEVGTYNVIMRDECSLTNPTIILELTEYPSFNYIRIPNFNRYYYVDNIINVNNKLWEIYLTVDVLYTYQTQILGLSAFIDRNEFDYNNNIINMDIVSESGYDIAEYSVPNLLFNYNFNLYTITARPLTSCFVVRGIDIEVDDRGVDLIPQLNINDNWLNGNLTGQILRRNKFDDGVVLSYTSFKKLLEYLLDVQFSDLVLGERTDFLSSITWYPFAVYPDLFINEFQDVDDITSSQMYIDGSAVDGAYGYPLYTSGYYNLGEFKFQPKFNNFADYSGFTHIQVFLPYLGYVDINPNDLIYVDNNGEIQTRYLQFRLQMDFSSGKGTYIIGVSDTSIPSVTYITRKNGTAWAYPRSEWSITGADITPIRILSLYETSIGVSIPIGRTNKTEIIGNIIRDTIKTAVGVGTNVYMNAKGYGSAQTVTSSKTVQKQYIGRKIANKWEETSESRTNPSNPQRYKQKAVSTAMDALPNVLAGSQFSVSSDRLGSASGFDAVTQEIKVIIKTPKLKELTPEYYHLYGAPVGETKVLRNCRGFTKITEVQIEGIPALAEELDEIEKLLYEGVII